MSSKFLLTSIRLVVIILVHCSVFASGSDSMNIAVPTTADEVNGMAKYILFTDSQSWNTARKVCKAIGGYLAKIDSQELLDLMDAQSEGATDTNWNDAWTGLHRNADDTLLFDDSMCSPFNETVSGTDIFKTQSDFTGNFGESSQIKDCYLINSYSKDLQAAVCDNRRKFICEQKTDSGSCHYISVVSDTSIVPLSNASSSGCQNMCNQQSGCYLAARYNSFCVLLTVPGSSNAVYQKDCFAASRNTTDSNVYRGHDDSYDFPTPCVPESGSIPAVNSTSHVVSNVSSVDLCPTSTPSNIYTVSASQECSSEVITISPSVSFVTVTETSTQTSTQTYTQSVTQMSTVSTTKTATETLNTCGQSLISAPGSTTITTTETSTEVLNTCDLSTADTTIPLLEGSCMTSTQILVTSTYLMTSTMDCSRFNPGVMTVTPSCPETSEMPLSPASCTCESLMPEVSRGSKTSSIQTKPSQTTICRTYNLTYVDAEGLDAILNSIVNALTLETKNLSKSVRTRTSAPDPRKSSQSIAFSAVCLVSLPLFLLLLFDLRKMFYDFRSSYKSITGTSTA